MYRVSVWVVAWAVALVAMLPGDVAAQDAATGGEPCAAAEDATGTPSASSAASPSATDTASPEASPQASPTAAECTIDIRDLAYSPGVTEVAVGTTVTWTNNDTVPHTATAADGTFDSGIFEAGESYSYTFEEAGTFDYTCLVHPEMKGTIVVR